MNDDNWEIYTDNWIFSKLKIMSGLILNKESKSKYVVVNLTKSYSALSDFRILSPMNTMNIGKFFLQRQTF